MDESQPRIRLVYEAISKVVKPTENGPPMRIVVALDCRHFVAASGSEGFEKDQIP